MNHTSNVKTITHVPAAKDGTILNRVVDVGCGFGFSCILLANGLVYGCGDNCRNQLGDYNGSQFSRVEMPEPIIMIEVGGDHLLAKSTMNQWYGLGSGNPLYECHMFITL